MPPVTRRAPGARALGQVGELQDAKYSLSQQVRELIDKYRQAERIVAHAKREVAGATAMMEQAMRDAERKSQSAVAKAEMRIRQVKHGAGAARGGFGLCPSRYSTCVMHVSCEMCMCMCGAAPGGLSLRPSSLLARDETSIRRYSHSAGEAGLAARAGVPGAAGARLAQPAALPPDRHTEWAAR